MIPKELISENRINKSNPGSASSVITPITDCTRPNSNSHAAQLRAYLDSPPEWFAEQASKCINEGKPERLDKSLASSVAADCLGEPFECREVLPAVEDIIEGEGVSTAKKIRCVFCKKGIDAHKLTLVPENLVTERCDEETAQMCWTRLHPITS